MKAPIQLIMYVRYPDLVKECIVTKFLTILRIEGSPTAENLYTTVDTFPKEKFFRCSHVRKEKLQSIVEMSNEYQQLVTYMYHKVRWLSLNDCVQRFVDLLPEIVCYYHVIHKTDLLNEPNYSRCTKSWFLRSFSSKFSS